MDREEQEVDLGAFFREIKVIAVVGYSDNPDRAGHYVAHYLSEQGYEILAINPRFGEWVNGLKCYADISAIPRGTPVDVVDVFRAPAFVPAIVGKVVQLDPRPRYVVLQPGAESVEGGELARENGIVPLEMCMMASHKIWGVPSS